ncbi:dipicolinate synthase subunit DpsA [Paenibacillus mucilaginosus]|uniref:Dipicolinate synthase subunit A n=3 Tax=Paenibacillus mucilaginosus TaxID=61624 RepID=H6NPB7_9BACL|nr:dipicolinate synthase subunit DpsA [Paenibacillus mucilaginosus]AEI44284.1 dipicolinate synthase subunit A [Paenibacillus mucilaginosus KNP414]AFC31827.1 dipicolinate synthase subunit A [Paenibacillus mucilaginosus 3016]AFH64182.1 dihydrofolate reductase [Paenibacillus mucilaginosus K02]MCG7216692.1 dipicolinate synthase subunit DpsA [Paenibacillus mucilaginosus]WDM25683.1 dipicolinate synthase subunit DpsA [Paenibacillus mucilaginosus]
MLTGIQVALIGGDARQLEVISKCSELDATVLLIGFDNLQNAFSGITKAEFTTEALEGMDAVILPAVGTDDSGRIDSLFSSAELRLTREHIAALPKHAKVFTGMAKPYLRELCAESGIGLIELFDRDDVAIYNSIPTAEGAIMMAIQNTDITIHGSTAMVLGFGRTGITLARTLQGMGARVKVGVNKPEYFARAYEMGLNPFHTEELKQQASKVDYVFNTIPAPIITAQVIAQMPHRALIIDLASRPGGTDFRFAEKRGVKAMLAPGLPGIVAPKTAGRIMADTITRIIMEEARARRNEE